MQKNAGDVVCSVAAVEEEVSVNSCSLSLDVLKVQGLDS
jgi:hypothetical protein